MKELKGSKMGNNMEMDWVKFATREYQGIQKLYEEILNAEAKDKVVYAERLLKLQKEDGSWCVVDTAYGDSDARVDFVYFPTYYATAALMNVVNSCGLEMKLGASLAKGLSFATGRNLMGHGYEGMARQLEALEVYSNAGAYEFLQMRGELFGKFNDMIKEIIEYYKKCLKENRTVFDWMEDYKEELQKAVSAYEHETIQYVWYAAYGSNINYERFMRYITACSDTKEPERSKRIIIPHDIYFAGSSSTWERKAVAFLDDTSNGMCFGRMYLITYQQYIDIQRMEGSSYAKKVCLGEEEGLPIYTFTSNEKRKDIGAPSNAYIQTILSGLTEVYEEKSELALKTYLFKRGVLNADDYRVLHYIRNSEHGVSVNAIAEATVGNMKAKKSVGKLISYDILKQDKRSVSRRETVEAGDAVVYTVVRNRELTDVLLSSYSYE